MTENVAVGNEIGTIGINLLSTSSNILNLGRKNRDEKKENIDIITLDYYIKNHNITRCDLVKIDVDGIEFEILKGSIELIKKLNPIFVVETNRDTRIIDFFIEQDYTVLNMKLSPIAKGEMPLNIFCIPI